ncbi:hypothetical protein ACQ4M3_04760 [Leptolyngbya sp. AN03gr2]|uniref:hypothetical protein n=1 Tax=unclassified Leptolyngbya TaxID=2650499 RepID=UPI003D316D7D
MVEAAADETGSPDCTRSVSVGTSLQGMSAKDAKKAIELVTENQIELLEKWEEFHG